ncbi:MAG: ABC transporter ATP-binding protein [Candidatus Gracilibacteria bacterium]|nr:ABC transporter ATP-binding protein [Candidatus Gracilibacteria bacterium]
MEYSDYLNKKQGSLYKIFDRGVEQQYHFIEFFFTEFFKNIISILAIVVILFLVDIRMAFLTLLMTPIMIGLGLFFMLKVGPEQKKLFKRWSNIFGSIGNILSAFSLTKTLGLEKKYKKEIKKDLNKIYLEQIKIDKFWSIASIYSGMIVMIARIIVLGFGVFFVIENTLSFADLFLFFSYIGWIYFPLGFLFSRLRNVSIQLTAVEEMHTEFDNMVLDNTELGKKIKNTKGKIEYSNVNFGYSEKQKILKDINFEINPGEKVAFVGNTGSGKSTIINLLFRFWEVSSGEILLDGKNIYKYSKESLRENIGIVSQDNSLFNTSIKQNLLYANDKATKKDLEKALKEAQCNFVLKLEKGIDTVIGERGLKLSGGEKQRLSIARLFLKNPKILILDEATSALDNKTEKLIQKSLDKLMKGRTTLVIAHRLSTIQNADKILMLEDGKIVEVGNYKELISKKAKFFELANPDNLIIN